MENWIVIFIYLKKLTEPISLDATIFSKCNPGSLHSKLLVFDPVNLFNPDHNFPGPKVFFLKTLCLFIYLLTWLDFNSPSQSDMSFFSSSKWLNWFHFIGTELKSLKSSPTDSFRCEWWVSWYTDKGRVIVISFLAAQQTIPFHSQRVWKWVAGREDAFLSQ